MRNFVIYIFPFILIKICVFAIPGVAAAGKNDVPRYLGYNRLMIPKSELKIDIDGNIEPKQWMRAAEITGFLRFRYRHRATEILPQEQRTHFYIMYSNEKLYIAMRSKNFPEGAPLKTDQKNNRDQKSIVFYDHFELLFSRTDDPTAALKKQHYSFLGNHRNSLLDQKPQPSVGQTGIEWNSDACYASKVTNKSWDMELAIPFKSMDEEISPKDFETWIMWLVRAYSNKGSDFFMWCGRDWMSWDEMPRVTFHSGLVAPQLKQLGEPLEGKYDFVMNFFNCSSQQAKVYFNLNITDQGKEVINYNRTIEIQGNGNKEVKFKKDGLPNNKTTKVTITAWMDGKQNEKNEDKSKPIVLYQQQFTVVPKNQKYIDDNFKHVKEFRNQRIDYKWKAAYMPSINAIRGNVNLDIDGVASKFQSAEAWRLKLKNVKSGEEVFSEAVPIVNLNAKIFAKIATPVHIGKFEIISELLSRDKNVIDRKSYSIDINKQEWEGYKGGIDDGGFVPPPYIPIKIDGNKLSVLNRTYTLNKSGLPESIICEGKELLAKPITFKVIINGKNIFAVGDGYTIDSRKAGKVTWTSTLQAGKLTIKLKNSLEYDGALFVDMEIIPSGGSFAVDGLQFVIDFNNPVNAVKAYRGSQYTGGGFMISPEQKGIIWESAKTRSIPNLIGSFNPSIYVGTPARGLWWYGKSDKGWILDDTKSATILRRNQNGNIELDQCLINKPVVMSKPREISFMIQAVPPKPLPDNWREISWGPPRIFGYGGWADGYYSFNYEKPENWKVFKKWKWHDKPVYVATEMIGRMTPGFSAYCGEWTGDSMDNRFKQENMFNKLFPSKHWKNAVGIVYKNKWKERTTNYIDVDVVPSLVDCRVWCFEQGVKLGGLRGYWWDMYTFKCLLRPEMGCGYLRDDGKAQGEFNYFTMRNMLKRMYHVAYKNGIEPEHWHYTGGALGSFMYGAWLTEGYYYMYSPGVNVIEAAPRDFWPVVSGKYTGTIPQMRSNFYSIGLGGCFDDIRPARAVLTLCFLNDVGVDGIDIRYRKYILDLLRKEGFLRTGVKSVVHWEKEIKENISLAVTDKDADILATVYILSESKLLLVLGNMSKTGSCVTMKMRLNAFTGDNHEINNVDFRDLETGINKLFTVTNGVLTIDKKIFVKGHDFRLFIIEENK